MNRFKEGDKVSIKRRGKFGWEYSDTTLGMDKNKIYNVIHTCYVRGNEYLLVEGRAWGIHPHHFKKYI